MTMPQDPLPVRGLSLDRLRRAAKRLKRGANRGDPSARARVQAVYPQSLELKHSHALHVIAREHGFASWPRLKLAVEIAAMSRAQRAERLKYALYLGQDRVSRTLLDDDPDLAHANFGLECALYDIEAVRRRLATDRDAATRIVGVRSPILHLAFSKHFHAVPDKLDAMIAVAEALTAAGADVNDSYPFEPGAEHRLSALYGALGHAGNLRLAEWLLERGADPDDEESLYHATELGHCDGLRLLMRYGVRTKGTNALARMLDFDNLEGARLLLEYGADPDEAVRAHPSGQPVPTVPALHQAARRGRDERFAVLLLAHGADPKRIWGGHSAYGLARIYGNDAFADALARAGHATPLSGTEAVLAACANGQAPRGRPLADLPDDDEARLLLTRIVLVEDGFDHARALVAAGLNPDLADEMDLTPLHLAAWAGLCEQVRWLLTLEPDLGHVNGYGGDLVGTIVHGSENRIDTGTRDHLACLRLVLEAGATIRHRVLINALDDDISACLAEWAETYPERVTDD